MGASERRKGHAWERRVARDLREWTGQKYERVLTETRDGNSGDVRLTDEFAEPVPVAAIYRTGRGGEKLAVLNYDDWLELVSALPSYCFVIQCKAGKRPPVYEAIKQATEAV